MKLQVLLSTMNQSDYSILDKMNINSDAIVVNQCDKFAFNEYRFLDNNIKFYSFNEVGVGLSRNTALMRATADICVLADDDLKYVEDYQSIILKEFKENPKADVIIFTVDIIDNDGIHKKKLSRKRVHFYNSQSFGAVRIGFRREQIINNNIFFSLTFGGGTPYGSGEDTIFLLDCLRNGLKIYTSPVKIADVYNYKSSWFRGYNYKFFYDKGALFKRMYGFFGIILCLQYIVRHRKRFIESINLQDALKAMIQGMKEYGMANEK